MSAPTVSVGRDRSRSTPVLVLVAVLLAVMVGMVGMAGTAGHRGCGEPVPVASFTCP